MHHIYSTNAFVLSSFPFGEAGKVLNLLTEDYGLIRVAAQGTRKTESKLKQSIQDFSLTKISMVLGKCGWKLTNAAIKENYFHKFDRETTRMVSRVFSLLERMIPDEEANRKIFNIISEMLNFLNLKIKNLESIEIATVLRIMQELGYIPDELDLYVELKKDFSDLVELVEKRKAEILPLINNAIKESHL